MPRRSKYRPQENEETVQWWSLSPAQRFVESQKLWATFLALGGSLEPEPDRQSPFYDPQAPCPRAVDGGQACVLYGAAEFSRDIDVAVLADDRNLDRLRAALAELQAAPVYVPLLSTEALQRGHACHFRANSAEVDGMRIDVMSVMRGCEPFAQLWARRMRLELPGVGRINVLALEDLVRAKQTQRDERRSTSGCERPARRSCCSSWQAGIRRRLG